MPDAAPNEAKNVEQSRTVMTRPRPEVKRKAYPAWTPDLCGHAVLAGRYLYSLTGGRQSIYTDHVNEEPKRSCRKQQIGTTRSYERRDGNREDQRKQSPYRKAKTARSLVSCVRGLADGHDNHDSNSQKY